MRLTRFGILLLALLPAPAFAARLYYGFLVGVTQAPAPPAPRSAREPRLVRANDAMVFVAQDDQFRFDGDLFRYGQYWFAYDHGYWYRARTHRGPYTVLDVRKVPRAILGVPRSFWKHHPLAVVAAPKGGERLAVAVRKPRAVVAASKDRERLAVAVREPGTAARRHRGRR